MAASRPSRFAAVKPKNSGIIETFDPTRVRPAHPTPGRTACEATSPSPRIREAMLRATIPELLEPILKHPLRLLATKRLEPVAQFLIRVRKNRHRQQRRIDR